MEPALAAACALSLHTLLAAGACTALSATVVPRLAACRRALGLAAAIAAPVAVAALGLAAVSGADLGRLVEPLRAGIPGCFTAAGTIAALGSHLVLHAAREESRRGAAPRGLLRSGGRLMFVGAVLAGGLGSLALASWAALPGAVACCAGGVGGLLAGISAKPRPSGPLAAIVYALGILLLCGAA